jgi:hypothetical protein
MWTRLRWINCSLPHRVYKPQTFWFSGAWGWQWSFTHILLEWGQRIRIFSSLHPEALHFQLLWLQWQRIGRPRPGGKRVSGIAAALPSQSLIKFPVLHLTQAISNRSKNNAWSGYLSVKSNDIIWRVLTSLKSYSNVEVGPRHSSSG